MLLGHALPRNTRDSGWRSLCIGLPQLIYVIRKVDPVLLQAKHSFVVGFSGPDLLQLRGIHYRNALAIKYRFYCGHESQETQVYI